jgi:hypothetical protein
MMTNAKGIVFISCGQRTPQEKALGGAIAGLVAQQTEFGPYFAEAQTTLEGLTKNIFAMLNRAQGLIAVLHARGTVSPSGSIRASVWVEQEIAIAAFLQQTLGRSIHVAAYLQKGVGLEGVREQLLLNPLEFEVDSQILDHLTGILPTWGLALQPDADHPLSITLNYSRDKVVSTRHDYTLHVLVTNTGSKPISAYHVDLEIPRALIADPEHNALFVPARTTGTHYLFRAAEVHHPTPIYPGDSSLVMGISYFVDGDIHRDPRGWLKMPVRASVYVPGYDPRTVEKSMAELQAF